MAEPSTYVLDPAIRAALGAGDVAEVLRLQRERFLGHRMDGSGDGGSGDGGQGGDGGNGNAGDGGQGGSGSGGDGDDSFPDGVPLEQMTDKQRAAYWKHYSRRNEDRLKAFGNLTPEKLAELQDKAGKHDLLERELMSDKDKAVAEAKDEASKETTAKLLPQLIQAEFRTEFKGRVADDQLDAKVAAVLGPLDLTKFLTDSGDAVDTAKVRAYVETIQPGRGTTFRSGPLASGHGSGAGGTQGRAGEAGAAAATRRFGDRARSAQKANA